MQTYSKPYGVYLDATSYQPIETTRPVTWSSASSNPLFYAVSGWAGRADLGSWTTDLWDRPTRSLANAEINRLQGQLRRTRSARAKGKIEMAIMRWEDTVRRSGT